ncbi:MAG: serine--tRNA ligase [Candidatus Harrisonbacteria bacterium CG10_big_fil_rev_8_21_14_0_10_44_23]|uniref:Serine--tRNA ligase n=1 Tax=Candidatus Harrisonbacteria bacterium CG10_big_fil_rev_8_21_14_0_10_44_23 TaxID=1974585 RepID=A0A2H0USF5_9BACT|nr:MAG: serine--tRNA ligase [Candidatus Harrisonbacteria bacterium CG10_big_fil_rev_8_21_14_0_10_44_23]
MIDIEKLRTDAAPFRESVRRRGMDESLIDSVLELDTKWRELLAKVEGLRGEQKKLGKEDIEKAKGIKAEISNLDKDLKEVEARRLVLLQKLPNLLHADVPDGKDESENKVVRTWGEPTMFNFEPKDHMEIGEALGIIDTEQAAKVSGARFAYLKGAAAKLQFALIQMTIDTLTNGKTISKIAKKIGVSAKPFEVVVPPVMIRPEVYEKMGRLTEEDKDERYKLAQDELYLIGSAEHTLGPLHMDQTLDAEKLPIRYLGYSTAFRREAGSYGKDTKGILRMHQFDKLEMESFTSPDDSDKEQDFIVALQEYLLQELGIPYQVVQICTGDMGKPDNRQVDIECWIPSQKKYRETHTSDLMTDYQTRRLNIKVQNGKKKEFAHTNDATAFAIGRTLIAILENYQNEDGSVTVPKALRKYSGLKRIDAE